MPPRRRARITEQEFFSRLEKYILEGRFTQWTQPWSFSEWLCQVQFGPDQELYEFFESDLNERLYASYQRTFQLFMRTMAPDGVWAARGLHGLSVRTPEEIRQLVIATEQKPKYGYTSYSLNLAYSLDNFALPETDRVHLIDAQDFLDGGRRFTRGLDAGGLIPVETDIEGKITLSFGAKALAWLNSQGVALPRHTPPPPIKKDKNGRRMWREREPSAAAKLLAQAMAHIETPVAIFARIPHDCLKSFGGDSESGFIEEAELHVKPCIERAVRAVYVLAPWQIGTPATDEQRKEAALSYYRRIKIQLPDERRGMQGRLFPTVLHGLVNCKSPMIREKEAINTVRKALTTPKVLWRDRALLPGIAQPSKYRWYKAL